MSAVAESLYFGRGFRLGSAFGRRLSPRRLGLGPRLVMGCGCVFRLAIGWDPIWAEAVAEAMESRERERELGLETRSQSRCAVAVAEITKQTACGTYFVAQKKKKRRKQEGD